MLVLSAFYTDVKPPLSMMGPTSAQKSWLLALFFLFLRLYNYLIMMHPCCNPPNLSNHSLTSPFLCFYFLSGVYLVTVLTSGSPAGWFLSTRFTNTTLNLICTFLAESALVPSSWLLTLYFVRHSLLPVSSIYFQCFLVTCFLNFFSASRLLTPLLGVAYTCGTYFMSLPLLVTLLINYPDYLSHLFLTGPLSSTPCPALSRLH